METDKLIGYVKKISKFFIKSPIIGPLLALLISCVFFSIQSDKFLTGTNLSFILQQVMVVGTLAIGQTLIILTAGIDLSVGSVMALGAIIMAGSAVRSQMPPLLAIGLGLLVTIGFGLLNGLLVTKIRLPAFIVTLGTLNIAFALTRIYTTQTVVNLPDEILFFGETFRIGNTNVTFGTVLMLCIYIITSILLKLTPVGRYVYSIGDNPEAARLAGISTTKVLLGVYIIAGLIYGIAGLLLMARTGVGDPQAGINSNLESITAVVLGGTSLFGGRGNILGTLIGAVIVGVFRNGLQLMGVSSIYQILITGVLVIVAVSIDQITHYKK